jgi:hypothetical protein
MYTQFVVFKMKLTWSLYPQQAKQLNNYFKLNTEIFIIKQLYIVQEK